MYCYYCNYTVSPVIMPLMYFFCVLAFVNAAETTISTGDCDDGNLNCTTYEKRDLPHHAPFHVILNYTYDTTDIKCIDDYVKNEMDNQMLMLNNYFYKIVIFEITVRAPTINGMQSVKTMLSGDGNHVSTILTFEIISGSFSISNSASLLMSFLQIYGDVRGGKFRSPCGYPMTIDIIKFGYTCPLNMRFVIRNHYGFCTESAHVPDIYNPG